MNDRQTRRSSRRVGQQASRAILPVAACIFIMIAAGAMSPARAQEAPGDARTIYLPAVFQTQDLKPGTQANGDRWEYIPGNRVWDLVETPGGGVVVGSDYGIVFWGPAGSRSGRQHLMRGPARSWSLAYDAHEGLWSGLAPTAGGFLADSPQGLMHRAADGILQHCDAADGLCRGWVNSLAAAPDGAIWAACLDEGIAKRDQDGGWTRYETSNSPLANFAVNDIAVDAEGGVWLALEQAGVQYIRPDGSWLDFPDLPVQSGMEAVAVDAAGRAWFAAREQGLLRVTPDGTWEQIPVPDLGGSDVQDTDVQDTDVQDTEVQDIDARDLAFARDGSLWIAGWSQVLRRDAEGLWLKERPDPSRLNPRIEKILVDRDGTVWAGGETGLYRRAADGSWVYLLPRDALPDRKVDKLSVGLDGQAWVIANGGLVEVAPQGLETRLKSRFAVGRDFPGGVNDVVESDDGLWVGTDGHGAAYRTRDGAWHEYRSPDGPVSDWVQAIVPDPPRYRVLVASGCEGCGQGGGVAIRGAGGQWESHAGEAGPGQVWKMGLDYAGVAWLSTSKGGRLLHPDGSLVEEDRARWTLGQDRRAQLWLGGLGAFVELLVFNEGWKRFDLPAGSSRAIGAASRSARGNDVWVISKDRVFFKQRDDWETYLTLAGLPQITPSSVAVGFYETNVGMKEVVWVGSEEGLFVLRD
jgi:ligand-binding sensor domain-containing protein